jgi:hypothetical protein
VPQKSCFDCTVPRTTGTCGIITRFRAGEANILILWGDDIGYWNVSAYNQGMMGYKTPNIDRIAHEGALFTDWYGQQSCTAGRAAFITGQSPIRTGLTKVGLPGAPEGLPGSFNLDRVMEEITSGAIIGNN